MEMKTFVKDRIKVYVVSFITIFSLIIGMFLIFTSLNIKSTNELTLLSYNEISNIDYNVYLKKNDYFKEEFLGKNKQYIASIIDYIDVFYDYSFSSSKDVDADFKYKIVATLTANHKVDSNTVKEVWKNDYVLLEEETKKISDTNTFSIKENVKVNYQDFNNIINNFKKDHMLAVSADLKIKLLVEVDGVYVPFEKKFESNSNNSLSIPLSEQTINIKMDYKDINNNSIVTSQKVSKFNNPIYFAIGSILTIIALVALVLEGLKIYKETKKQSKYIKELRKILHDYADIIIEVNEPPVLPKEKVSQVINFNELVNAQIEVKSPIIFAETKENEEGLFVVNAGDYCYYYILKSNENDK